jgi:hypothetical protein
MSTISVQSEVSIDAMVRGVEQLSTPDLEQLVDRVLAIRARRRAPSLTRKETDLLRRINQGITPNKQVRFDELTAKRRADTLTSSEHQELLELLDLIEQHDVKRMEALAELAQLRNLPIRVLIKDLGIHPSDYA